MLKSNRLKTIASLVSESENIYDLCCDHGNIGLYLYQKKLCKYLYLNDQVDTICQDLEFKIKNVYSYIPSDVFILKKPCQTIKFKENSNIILVGVGINTIEPVLTNIPRNCELILSSHTKPIELRAKLNPKFSLISEHLIQENGQFYEVLKLTTYRDAEIPLIGSFEKNSVFQAYLENLKLHYQRKATLGNDTVSKEILKYIALKQKEF